MRVSRWCIRGCAQIPNFSLGSFLQQRICRSTKLDPSCINLRCMSTLSTSFRIFSAESVAEDSARPLDDLGLIHSMAPVDDQKITSCPVIFDNGSVGNENSSREEEIMRQSLCANDTERRLSLGRRVEDLPDWAIARTEFTTLKMLTLVIVHKDGKVLLGMKKRGFGKGYYNGFGGKVEKGETIDEAAKRELLEEAGITPVDMSRRGVLTFHFDHDPVSWEVHVYHVSEIVGDPCETEEMAPRWFSVSEIPYETMWSDNVLWYPAFFGGQSFKGRFYFENTTTLVSHSLQIT